MPQPKLTRSKLTETQLRLTSGWGQYFLRRAGALIPGFQAFVTALRNEGLFITAWDDCAGGDMPHFVFKELELPTVVIALCERAAGPRKWLKANVPHEVLFDDLFTRNHKSPSPRPRGPPAWYSAGFPCKAFSLLRTLKNKRNLAY